MNEDKAIDTGVLARISRGDAQAMNECIARYRNLVRSIVRRYEPVDAEDLVQEIFVGLWQQAARFDPAIAPEAAFVAMIARRRAIDRRRMRMRRPATEPLCDDAAGSSTVELRTERADACKAVEALDRLRPEQRRVLVLATGHGLSHREVAARTGLPLGTVKSHVRRGLLELRQLLEREVGTLAA